MPGLVELYQRMPYPARVAAASARGARLHALRYGAETDALADGALAREAWDARRWESVTARALAATLDHAARTVPAYADRLGGADPRDLASWPVLTKAELRADGASLRSTEPGRGRLVEEHSSGSTGTPVTVWLDRDAVRRWYALLEARLRRWNGVDRHTRWAIVGGQLVTRPGGDRPPYWVWNAPMHQLYLSALDISPRTVADYADALARHRVRFLHGYPSALHALAAGMEQAGVRPPTMAVAISNAEPLLDHQRETIGRVFGCPVRDTYGMTEIVAGASECAAGRLHLWPEVGVVEVLDDAGDPVPPGGTGRLVCTGLLNRAMPLIRYEVGDRGRLADEPCPCGRGLPVLAAVEGRLDDVVLTADGRQVGRLDHVFKADVPVLEAQIVQRGLGDFVLRIVPAPGWTPAAGAELADRLRERVGPASVDIEVVDALERSANGKLRAVVSLIAPAPA